MKKFLNSQIILKNHIIYMRVSPRQLAPIARPLFRGETPAPPNFERLRDLFASDGGKPPYPRWVKYNKFREKISKNFNFGFFLNFGN